MPHVAHVFTVDQSLGFLEGQLPYLARRGYEFSVITSPGDRLAEFGRRVGVRTIAIEMPRRISPWSDALALAKMAATLRRLQPDIVHAHTPKGGLLGSLGAWMAGVDHRIYHMRGLPLATATGARRKLLGLTERTACMAATRVLSVSHSLRQAALQEHLCEPGKITVPVHGSGNGVDALVRFTPDGGAGHNRSRTRHELHLTEANEVVLFVGRLAIDKGIGELARSWPSVSERHPSARLVIVGEQDERDPVPAAIMNLLRTSPSVQMIGHRRDLAALYAASDVVVLPTYREGFPNVPLEAAAMGKPVVASRVTGCVDAIVHGETGMLVPPRDALALSKALAEYLGDPALRQAHGRAGRQRVLRDFEQSKIWDAIGDIYDGFLGRSSSTLTGTKPLVPPSLVELSP